MVFSADSVAFTCRGGFSLDCVCGFMEGVRGIPPANISWWIGFAHPQATDWWRGLIKTHLSSRHVEVCRRKKKQKLVVFFKTHPH